jgi:hypothetical protein
MDASVISAGGTTATRNLLLEDTMCHIEPDFATKKAFKDAFKAGVQIRCYNPSGIFPQKDGKDVVEAPASYHRWYSQVMITGGYVSKILG